MGDVTSDSGLLNILKIWYSDRSPEDVFFRNSPIVKQIPKSKIGGKQYNVPLLLGNGGNASGDLLVSTNGAQASGYNAEFQIKNGYMFASFPISVQEVKASQTNRGAYMPIPVQRMAQGLDSFRKLAATAFYGSGFGEIGLTGATFTTANSAGNVFTLKDKSQAVKLSVGSRFKVTEGATPGSNLRPSVNTITKIDGLTITFTATAVDTWAATDWIEIYGCRDTGNNALLPVGMAGWLPTIANRTGATWTGYIDDAFFGVDRSIDTNGAAGQFILRNSGASEKYVDAIVRGVEAVRTAGGVPDMIVVNSSDYNTIVGELNSATNLFQSVNTAGKATKNEVTRGISDMKFAFSTSYVDMIYDDPFCPTGTAYIFEKDNLEMACLTNSDTPFNDGVAGNEPGKPALTDTKAPELNYFWLIEDYITIQPGAMSTTGPALQVIIQLYGSYVLHNPSKACVIKFA